MNSQNKKRLQIVLLILIGVLTLGIGYASISAINLVINGNATASVNQSNFRVRFLNIENETPTITSSDGGTGNINIVDDLNALFNITGLDAAGESATINLKVKNESNDIGAKIGVTSSYSKNGYFKVTTTVVDDELQAGDETDVIVKIEMIKTPINDSVTTSITTTLTASPLENVQATGSNTTTVSGPRPYVYTINDNYNNTIVNNAIPNEINQYNSFNNPDRTAFGHPASLAHILEDGVIRESYVAFERNGEIYYLRGGVVEEIDQDITPIYDSNIAELKKAFGPTWSDYCSEEILTDYNYKEFTCRTDEYKINVETRGNVFIETEDYNWYCYVDIFAYSACNT